jgi:lysophospholipase L1-like esterase
MPYTILCYGDSNTWGCTPIFVRDGEVVKDRYPRHIRWTGQLQKLLGDNYYVVEEGLNSRTTNLDHPVPPDRNGKNYLLPCLYSHAPIDLVVLLLGGNDLKNYFKRTPEDVQAGLAELVDMIKTSDYGPNLKTAPAVLIVTSPIPLPFSEELLDENGVAVFAGGVAKSKRLIELYAELAKQTGCYYIDISEAVMPSPIDGIHFDEPAHDQMAKLMCEKITAIHSL